MNCKNCGNPIDKDAKFCPYCGKSIKQEEVKKEYDDPFKDLRINTTHEAQYQYQQHYSNQNQTKHENELNKPKVNKSLIGIILGIISIFICFIKHCSVIGIGTAIAALTLAIIGCKYSSKGFGIFGIITTIFTLIITLIINVVIFIMSLEITFSNGYTTTIKDYFISAFFCGYNEHHLEGYWIDDYGSLLYLDDEGNYYIYADYNELTDNYYYGTYEIEEGLAIGNDEVIFDDEDYYFYEMKTITNKAKISGTIYYETIDLIKNGFTLKLDKESKNHLVLVGKDGETELEFEKERNY